MKSVCWYPYHPSNRFVREPADENRHATEQTCFSNPNANGIIFPQRTAIAPHAGVPLVEILQGDAVLVGDCPAAVSTYNDVPFLAGGVST